MFPSNLPVNTSDMQRTMTFHISSASLFLSSQFFSALLGCFIPVLVPSSVCGQGQGLPAPVLRWPCGQALTPLLLAICITPGLPLCHARSSTAASGHSFPICPLSGQSIDVRSYFLTRAEGEFWEQDVEIQQCISERRNCWQ